MLTDQRECVSASGFGRRRAYATIAAAIDPGCAVDVSDGERYWITIVPCIVVSPGAP